jgi:hypothetical protein
MIITIMQFWLQVQLEKGLFRNINEVFKGQGWSND